jgi:hypothetical protein
MLYIILVLRKVDIMPQLSLYFDKATLEQVDQAAKLSKTSMSKWVRQAVIESLNNEWTEGFFDLCGSIDDDSLEIPEDSQTINSTPRDEL